MLLGDGSRAFKALIGRLLGQSEPLDMLDKISGMPPFKAVNALFSFLISIDPIVKWRAVTAMGYVVNRIAVQDMEGARVIMRRLMWQLNDESGGIGWGCPEAMGEILAGNEDLAGEYAHVLRSYIDVRGNFIEHEPLQEGVLWGLGRLAQERPGYVKEARQNLFPFISSGKAPLRGLAIWCLGFLGEGIYGRELDVLKPLCENKEMVKIYTGGVLRDFRVGDLAGRVLERHGKPCH